SATRWSTTSRRSQPDPRGAFAERREFFALLQTTPHKETNMAKLILQSYPAERNGVFLSIVFTSRDKDPLPPKTVEITRVADAEAALNAYVAEVTATGKPAAVSMRMARGDRAPPGFKKLKAAHHYVEVNC